MNERDRHELIQDYLARFEGTVEKLDAIASKQADAAETMRSASNDMWAAASDFGTYVQNLEGSLSRDRRIRKTGG